MKAAPPTKRNLLELAGDHSTPSDRQNGQRVISVLFCGDFHIFQRCNFRVLSIGNQAQGSVLSNLMVNGMPLLPKWFLLMTYVSTLVQVYMQPTNVVIERKFADPKMGELSIRNTIPRLIFRSLSVIIATTLAAMLPFFGDIMALFGAFGCIPLDFILPMVFYNVTFKPSKKSLIFCGNTVIAVVSTVLAVVGAVASVWQIVLNAKTYKLFANM
ncbi:UNVERIFIED_CONTAM: GABA transporter 1 [Sesamum angustifolium]|uniref:GABA transporter 1 n=1 Tax=Sesamum angustifolium TaxID=2727405 RepID=A0AAW2LFE6_9LAMI